MYDSAPTRHPFSKACRHNEPYDRQRRPRKKSWICDELKSRGLVVSKLLANLFRNWSNFLQIETTQ